MCFFLYIYIPISIYIDMCVHVCVCVPVHMKDRALRFTHKRFRWCCFSLKAHKLLKNWNHRRYWTLDVSRTASYEITLVRLSVRPSVTKFCQNCIFSFFDTVYENSWPWYLVTEVKLTKKLAVGGRVEGWRRRGTGWREWRGRGWSRHFLKFASLVFLNSSLGQCLTSSKAETSKTNFVAQIRA